MERLECSHLDPILVLAIQNLHGFDGLGDGTATANENTINIESKGETIGDDILMIVINRGADRRRSLRFWR